jgi:hypothetical protein
MICLWRPNVLNLAARIVYQLFKEYVHRSLTGIKIKNPFKMKGSIFKMGEWGLIYLVIWYSSIFLYSVVRPMPRHSAAFVLLPLVYFKTFWI